MMDLHIINTFTVLLSFILCLKRTPVKLLGLTHLVAIFGWYYDPDQISSYANFGNIGLEQYKWLLWTMVVSLIYVIHKRRTPSSWKRCSIFLIVWLAFSIILPYYMVSILNITMFLWCACLYLLWIRRPDFKFTLFLLSIAFVISEPIWLYKDAANVIGIDFWLYTWQFSHAIVAFLFMDELYGAKSLSKYDRQ